eukprot:scaffold74033_cov41-Tisochrysis_lutea.AAC.3
MGLIKCNCSQNRPPRVRPIECAHLPRCESLHPATALRKSARMVIHPPAYEMEIASGEKRWRRPIDAGELPASPFSTSSQKPSER